MTAIDPQPSEASTGLSIAQPLSRRRLLQGALAGAAMGVAGLPFGWDSVSAHAMNTPPLAERPKRGGRLRAAFIGNGVVETLDPDAIVADVDIARAYSLFDQLTRLNPDGTYALELAESFEPTANARTWTVRLRPGVTWHDGKPLTADDVIYTLRRIGAPKSTLGGASTVALIDITRLQKLDKLTVRMPLKQPIAELP